MLSDRVDIYSQSSEGHPERPGCKHMESAAAGTFSPV